jgi:hypothetical protein
MRLATCDVAASGMMRTNIIIVEKKLKAIALFKFSENLIAFKRYLSLTDYLRNKIYFFAEMIMSLQKLKTKLLKNSSTKARRKEFINQTRIILINKEMIYFLLLQENLIKITLLIHFDKTKWLWIDLDEFKEFDFEVIVFHVTKKFLKEIWSMKDDIQSIMFLSRLLTSVERNYWSIELKIVELIWVIKKVRHLIQSSKKSIIIQTNHAAIIDIWKQTSIISTNLRMILRLVRASQFLSQFSDLKIRHKLEKYYLISDALFRLQNLNKKNLLDDHDELDELFVEYTIFVIYVYNTILIKLNSKFRTRIIEKYSKNESWRKIIQIIDQNETLNENVAELSFVREFVITSRKSDLYMTSNVDTIINNSSTKSQLLETDNKNLIYHVNRSTKEKRLCISSNCVQNILVIAHDQDQNHSEFDACFEIISRSWYIRKLTKAFRSYIKHCSQCLQIQIKRHRSWENLQFIHSSSISLHTIILNLVLSLSKIKEEINCVLSIIDKFTKRVMLISKKFTHTTEDWSINLLEKLKRRN